MHRRRFVATVAAVGSFGIAGCVYGARDPSLSVSGLTVRPGARGAIVITAPTVVSLHVDEHPEGSPPTGTFEYIDIAYGSVQLSPSPDVVWEGDPPSWGWNPARSVTGLVPVGVSVDAPRGEYRFAVRIRVGDTDARRTRLATITVAEGAGT